MTKIIDLTAAQLVEIYNTVSPRSVKKFRDLETARKRTQDALDNAGKTFWFADDETLTVGDKADKPRPKARPRTEYQDNYRIEVRVADNPKRKGSKAHARFALYRDGMTVAEFKAACVKHDGKSARPAHRYLADLHWDEKHQFITVWTPALVEELDPEERAYAPA